MTGQQWQRQTSATGSERPAPAASRPSTRGKRTRPIPSRPGSTSSRWSRDQSGRKMGGTVGWLCDGGISDGEPTLLHADLASEIADGQGGNHRLRPRPDRGPRLLGFVEEGPAGGREVLL